MYDNQNFELMFEIQIPKLSRYADATMVKERPPLTLDSIKMDLAIPF